LSSGDIAASIWWHEYELQLANASPRVDAGGRGVGV